ncbi:DUF3795 domain-containing protein [candidate division TA06 bacterium]|nr:DUF3795 domain-containing protein [candidate division TA06 bacterium]
MVKIISYCGLDCSACPAYIAAQKDDPELRANTAAHWSKLYQSDIKPEDVFCQGCHSDGERLFNHCRVCLMRQCGKNLKLKNCAHCPDYACEKLKPFLEMVPEAKANLESIRQKNTKQAKSR